MTNSDLNECRTCGAMVEQGAKHKEWHEVLSQLVPDLDAELERRKEQRRARRTGKAAFL